MSADISRSLRHNLESLVLGRDNGSDPQVYVGDTTYAALVSGIYVAADVSVTIPTIADAENDEVAVDVAAAFPVSVAIDDFVIVNPTVALPTSCLFEGAYISDVDEVTFAFGTLEGGAGVTGAAKTFNILLIKAA